MATPLLAQPAAVDLTFDPGAAVGSLVLSVALQSDGKVLIGGFFTNFNGTNLNRIARLNADGSPDLSFNPGTGANAIVQSIALQSDGKVLIAGAFTNVNGTNRNRIARLNANGSLDTSFDPGTGAATNIDAVVVQPDGKILIGGLFTNFNETNLGRIARLNTDGTLDPSFSTTNGASSNVETIALQSDGRILLGGFFTNIGGVTRNRIARLNTNGTLDVSFTPGSGANDVVQTIAVQPDGNILLAGRFTNFDGTTRNRIARLSPAGLLDGGFDAGPGANTNITALAIQPDGRILVAGFFTNFGGATRNRIARLNTDGSLDPGFDPGTGANADVQKVVLQPDGKVLIGGAFTNFSGVTRRRVARLIGLATEANPDSLATAQNAGLLIDPATLLTNDTAASTNSSKALLVGAVTYFSTQGGIVSKVATQLWVARYNGNSPASGEDQARSLAVDSAGNAYVTGFSFLSASGLDYATIQYDTNGNGLWTNRYNGPGNSSDRALALVLGAATNVFVTGRSVGSGTSDDYATINYTAGGTGVWTNRYAGPTNTDIAQAIGVDSNDAVYITGQSFGSGTVADYGTIKYAAGGAGLWTNRYNGPGDSHDVSQSLAVDGSGDVVVTGYSWSGIGPGYDYATIKYDSSGAGLWTNRFNGPDSDYDVAYVVAVDANASVYVSGYSRGTLSSEDYATIKYSSSGIGLWTNRYNGPGNGGDAGVALKVDQSGNVLVTGSSPGGGSGFDFATIKYDANGTGLWTNRFAGAAGGDDESQDIALDVAGNVYVTGTSWRGAIGSNDFATIKYNPAGDVCWTNYYDGPAFQDDHAYAVALSPAGDVYVAGASTGVGTGLDYAVVKYGQRILYQPPPNFIGLDTFTYTIYDVAGNAATTTVSVLVGLHPAITSQPQNQTVAQSNMAVFAVGATGAGTLSYQWRKSGTNIPGATVSFLTFGSAQTNDAGTYDVVVTNSYGAATSQVAMLTVLLPPSIASQPMSQTVTNGATNVSFSVSATGSPVLRYQWRLNGVNIVGETNSTFTIPIVDLADGGSYTVVVANDVGAVTSDPAILSIAGVPILAGGDNFTNRVTISGTNGVVAGTNSFTTREAGEPSHAGKPGSNSVWYTWTAPANGIATFHTIGSTFDTLLALYTGTNLATLASNVVAGSDDEGGFATSLLQFNAAAGTNYQIALDGFAGATGRYVLNWSLETTNVPVPVILVQPQSQTVTNGATVTLSVTATNGAPFTYRWYRSLGPLGGATNATLIITNFQGTNVGVYVVAVTNSFGRAALSRQARVEIGPVSTVQSRDKFEEPVGGGGGGGGGGSGPVGFASSSGNVISVSAGSLQSQVLDITTSVSQANEGNCGTINQGASWLPFQAEDTGVFIIETVVDPTNAFSDFDTLLAVYIPTNIGGVDFAQLVACDNNSAPDGYHSLVRLTNAQAGTLYQIAVDRVTVNVAGGNLDLTEFKPKVTARLGQPPMFSQPSMNTNIVVQLGGIVTFSAGAVTGTPAPTYQWRKNGIDQPGQTNATLTLNDLQSSQAGRYDVVVSNFVGAATNNFAVLLLQSAMTFANPSFQWHLYVIPGESYVLDARTNLLINTWVPLATNQPPDGSLLFTDGPLTGITNRTYRVRLGE